MAAVAALLAATCSRLYVRPAGPGKSPPGFRYYLPRPFLLVTSDSAKVIWLPDYTQSYAVDPRFGLGTLKLDLTLNDGWRLSQVGTDADSKVPETIDKLLSGVTGGITAAAAAAAAVKSVKDSTHPGLTVVDTIPLKSFTLYSFEYDESGRLSRLIPVAVSQ